MSAATQVKATVDILGERYTIRGEADQEYIAEVGRMVDLRMRELHKHAPNLSSRKLAVLTAINIADELLQQKNTAEALPDNEISQKTSQLITLLDEGLIGDML